MKLLFFYGCAASHGCHLETKHMNQLAVMSEYRQIMSVDDVRAQVNQMQEIMAGVMKGETHYGIIPGAKAKTLYKAGSEVLLSAFKISVEPMIEDLSTHDEIRYRIKAVGTHSPSGLIVGYGIGECSSNEEKYKWRRTYIDKEFDDTPEDRRRIKYSSYRGKVNESKQIRVNIADIANTVLKMAKKRAQIDLTLTATAASDIFTQDIEDLPDEYMNQDNHEPDNNPPAAEKNQLPVYSDGDITANTEKWKGFFAAKKQNPDGLINKISSKYSLTDQQKQTIRNMGVK